MLKIGATQTYCDPICSGINDIQELSKTHEVVRRSTWPYRHKTRTYHPGTDLSRRASNWKGFVSGDAVALAGLLDIAQPFPFWRTPTLIRFGCRCEHAVRACSAPSLRMSLTSSFDTLCTAEASGACCSSGGIAMVVLSYVCSGLHHRPDHGNVPLAPTRKRTVIVYLLDFLSEMACVRRTIRGCSITQKNHGRKSQHCFDLAVC